jgi:Flp pilus assembly protein TadD
MQDRLKILKATFARPDWQKPPVRPAGWPTQHVRLFPGPNFSSQVCLTRKEPILQSTMAHQEQMEDTVTPLLPESLPKESNPDLSEQRSIWLATGMEWCRRSDYGRARTALEQASDVSPLDDAAACALAECYLQTGRPTLAVDLFCSVADHDDCPADLLPTIAAGLGRAGDNQAAFEVCRLAADRQPSRPEPLFGMAFYLRRLGYPAQAIVPIMGKACELSGGQSLYRCTLAFLLAQDDRTEDAFELLQEIRPEEVGTPCVIQQMMAIFQQVGDYSRWSDCRAQLADGYKIS